MVFPYEEFDLSGVKTYPLKSRRSKTRAEDFARPAAPGGSVGALVDSLPDILAAADFKTVVRGIAGAKRSGAGGDLGNGADRSQNRVGRVTVVPMAPGCDTGIGP